MNINTIQAAAEIAKTLRDGSLTAKENLEDNLLGIIQRNRELLPMLCVYCGFETHPSEPEYVKRMANHVVTCEKSPLVKLVKNLELMMGNLYFCLVRLRTEAATANLSAASTTLESAIADANALIEEIIKSSGETRK